MDEATLLWTGKLAARIAGRFCLTGPAGDVSRTKQTIQAIQPFATFDEKATGLPPIRIGPGEHNCIRVAADGWRAYVSPPGTADPPPSKSAFHPATPLLAACMGVAAWLARTDLPLTVPLDDDARRVNLWTGSGPPPELARRIDIDWHILGLGSIGSTVVALLAEHPEVRGRLHVLDCEATEPRNLASYGALADADTGKRKTDWVLQLVARHSNLKVTATDQPINQWVRTLGHEPIGLTIIALDNVDARRDAADVLPRIAVSASADNDEATSSKCDFLHGICSFCQFTPKTDSGTHYQLSWSNWFGLDLARVHALTWSMQMPDGQRLAAQDLERIERHLKMPTGHLAAYQGKRLEDLYERLRPVFYSTATIKGHEATNLGLPHPLAGSAAAALALSDAIELTIDPNRNSWAPNTRTLRPFRPQLQAWAYTKPRNNACLCQNAFRRSWYAQYHGPRAN